MWGGGGWGKAGETSPPLKETAKGTEEVWENLFHLESSQKDLRLDDKVAGVLIAAHPSAPPST